MRLLFLRRDDCYHSDRAEAYLRQLFDVSVVRSRRIGDKLPDDVRDQQFDALFAFRAHIIVPGWLIKRTKICLNFHPGPPERPGIGCVNFALYEGDHTYGSTCHHIVEEIDAGAIVNVKRFPIDDNDTIASLLARSYDYLLCQLYDVAPVVASGADPGISGDEWPRKATTKKDLDRLMQLSLDASPEEIARVVRATSFGTFGPQVTIDGAKYRLVPADEPKPA